jgi:hypothetical protein
MLLELYLSELGFQLPRSAQSIADTYKAIAWLHIDFLERKGFDN